MIAAKERWSTPRDHTVVAKVRARNLEIKVLEKKYNKLFKEKKKGFQKATAAPGTLIFFPIPTTAFLTYQELNNSVLGKYQRDTNEHSKCRY